MNFKNFIKEKGLYAVTGPAGAGKTTFVEGRFPFYSLDWRFIHDSNQRREFLDRSSLVLEKHFTACNQYSWWNWNKIEEDLEKFLNKIKLTLLSI